MFENFKERQEKWKKFAEWEDEYIANKVLSLHQRLTLANSFFQHVHSLKKFHREDPLEGLEEKISYLKKLRCLN
jgi:hypothetical protein